MDMRKRIALIAAIIIIAAGLLLYFYLNRPSTELIASGTIEATEVTVSSRSVGRVLELRIDEGSDVKTGEVIAVLESREAFETAKSAQARLSSAKSDYERAKRLFLKNLISKQQYEAAATSLAVLDALYQTAKIQLENTTISSPLKGTVLTKAIEAGELATVGTPIATLADLSQLKLTVYLAEKDVGKVKLKESVLVSVDSFPNEKFKGYIDYISDKAEFTPKSIQTKEERVTQVFAVKIKIQNLNLKLKPGMPADAEFRWNSQ